MPNQVIKGRQCRRGTSTCGNDDLLERHVRAVTGSKHAGQIGFTLRIDLDLAKTRQAHRALEVGYISTGGGAFLEVLEGKTLPAFEILEKRANG